VPVADPDPGASRDEESPDGTGPLWEAVRALPPQQRAAVAHRFVLDMTYADVAEAMGTTEDAARANVYQGLKKLRERTGNPHAFQD
jgi:RNA polymerase sigma factor (sigma-70 family)